MKHILLFTCLILANCLLAQPIDPPYIRIGGTFDTNTNQVVGGTTHANNSIVWIDCGTSNITVSVPIMGGTYAAIWNSSSNITLTSAGGISFIQTVQLDPNKGDGDISVVYLAPPASYSSNTVRIYIRQKPSVPSLVTSQVCPGNSATFTATSTYGLQSTKPMSLIWQTTGGVTVNSTNNYTQPNVTVGSVTISNSSTGNVSVRAVVPGCSNLQTASTGRELGAPTIKNPNYWLFDPGSNMWQFSQISEYPSTTYTFNVTSGSASVIQNAGDAYITTSAGATICVTGTNSCGSGTPFCFYIPAAGGMLKAVSPNPAQDNILVQFHNAEKTEFFPTEIQLFHESSTSPVKTISVQNALENRTVIDGDKLKIPVSDLPRGIYYLHAIPAQGSKQDIQKVRIVLN